MNQQIEVVNNRMIAKSLISILNEFHAVLIKSNENDRKNLFDKKSDTAFTMLSTVGYAKYLGVSFKSRLHLTSRTLTI